jgi:hypothetical protein
VTDYPEHEKLSKVRDKSQAIGEFIDWLKSQGVELSVWIDDEHQIPYLASTEKILANYFCIDLDRLEAEKRQMLDEIRERDA